jgi:hypothetical protein
MRILFLCFIAFIIAGCRTSEQFEKNISTWIGRSETELVIMEGTPDGVYQIDENQKVLTYKDSRQVISSGSKPQYRTRIIGTTPNTLMATTTSYGGSSPKIYTKKCTKNFIITDGIITDIQWKGGDCKAAKPNALTDLLYQ